MCDASTPNGLVDASSARAHVTAHAAARIFSHLPFGGYQAGSPLGGSQSSVPADPGTRIIFSPAPALLIHVGGEPQYEPVIGTDLQRVINTTALIVSDPVGMHYLRRGDTWMEAYGLSGPWSISGTVPEGADVALKLAQSDSRTNLFASVEGHRDTPAVYVSTTPAELIVTDGEPEYAPFNGSTCYTSEYQWDVVR